MTARAQRKARLPRGPFSRFVDVASVPDDGFELTIEATPDECAAVAAANTLAAVRSLTGRFTITRRIGGRYGVTGDVQSTVTRTCVVSLDPFDSTIEQAVDLVFAQATSEPGRDVWDAPRGVRSVSERPVAPAPVPGNDDQIDPPDAIIDGTIDLGAVAVEFVILACDPYPRKPGVAFVEVVIGDDAAQPSAFAALERLKERS